MMQLIFFERDYMRLFHSMGHLVGGTLLIAGTMIGVGMLGLPVATGPGGFFPSVVVYFLCWLFMLATGLLVVEICLHLPKDTNFLTMAERLLGPFGKALFWLVYLFLYVTVMIAHISGGASAFNVLIGETFSGPLATTVYTLLIIPVIYLGTKMVDRINMILISGVLLTYFAFVFFSFSHVDPGLLLYSNWSKAWIAFPVLFTAFTYQVIVPTLMTYMNRDAKKVRLSIFYGSLIALVVYLIWEYLILGIVPAEGVGSLAEAAVRGDTAVGPLSRVLNAPHLSQVGSLFAFFAMTTSFVPFALSFFDFLADGFKAKKKGGSRVMLLVAVFGAPLVISLFYPALFLTALRLAGGISCAFLFGLMPPVMAWIARYVQKAPAEYRQLPFGKPLLVCLMAFALFILGSELLGG
jgi:tyrosine-specific transport protein